MRLVGAFIFVCGLTVLAALTPAGGTLIRLSDKLPVLLAVLLAAVFVRLARGMPTIPYDKVAETRARLATAAFRKLVTAYVQTFGVFIVAILINLLVSTASVTELSALHPLVVPITLAVINGLVIVSIVFLVTSDVSLSRIQADMMDEVISAASSKEASKSVETVQRAFARDAGPKITQL